MTEYFIDLRDLGEEKLSFKGAFKPGDIDFSSDNVSQSGLLQWSVLAERAGSEVRITGSIDTTIEMICSRCLEAAPYNVKKSFDLFFQQRDQLMFDEDQEIELKDRDTRVAFFTGAQLAIGEILHEQVLLALPMKALCRVDCKGLCPHCGTNLNSGRCDCPKEQFNPHMDALLEVKQRLEKRSS